MLCPLLTLWESKNSQWNMNLSIQKLHLLHYKHQAVDELLKKFSAAFTFYNMGIKDNDAKLFTRFLKENNCYSVFRKNFKSGINERKYLLFNYYWHQCKFLDNFEGFKQYCSLIDRPKDILLFSFSWEISEEGFDFWDLINDKWTNFLLKKR